MWRIFINLGLYTVVDGCFFARRTAQVITSAAWRFQHTTEAVTRFVNYCFYYSVNKRETNQSCSHYHDYLTCIWNI